MENRLNVVKIASMYIAVIMGAGFCSGRESWQFFGVFGRKGYLGAALAGLGFVVFALMFTYIAIRKKTDDLGMLISPWNNKYIVSVIGWTMPAFSAFSMEFMPVWQPAARRPINAHKTNNDSFFISSTPYLDLIGST